MPYTMAALPDPEALAKRFHETYERLAPEHGYETRRESAVPWDEVPEQNRNLMIATCAALITEHTLTTVPPRTPVFEVWADLIPRDYFIRAIKAIRAETGLSLAEAKYLADTVPKVVVSDRTREEAERIADRMNATCGMRVFSVRSF